MRALGQIVMCLLLTMPAARAAVVPLGLELDRAASIVRAVEQQVIAESARLALDLEEAVRPLRTIANLPLVRDLARALGFPDPMEIQWLAVERHATVEGLDAADRAGTPSGPVSRACGGGRIQ